MRKIIILIIVLLFLVPSCLNKNKQISKAPHTKKDKEVEGEDFIFLYSKDSIFVKNKKGIIFKDFNWRNLARDNKPKEAIYQVSKDGKQLYLFNFGGGLNLINLDNGLIMTKKVPRHYNTSKTKGNVIYIHENNVILANKLYAIVYDDNLQELFLPFDFISDYNNNKYEQILESDYKIKSNKLTVSIRYLENWEKEKDTVFSFNLD